MNLAHGSIKEYHSLLCIIADAIVASDDKASDLRSNKLASPALR
ncbi:MAG: hypothetical protein SWZ49_22130 [Cyanobacteriota bacterium]|nr:hypothetical protein [Cyanobacteriota bacterium]